MPMRVAVVPHDPVWADMFAVECTAVSRALGSNTIAIHHIGSTAIPFVYAKAIIDMLVEVADIEEVDEHNPAMEALGYEPMGECGISGRRYFRKDNDASVRTHHAHVFAAGRPDIVRHLAFRDFLLAHAEWATRYSDLKKKLAQAHPDDIDLYMAGKDAFIKDIDKKAAVWRTGLDG